jgi:hypothetical protein
MPPDTRADRLGRPKRTGPTTYSAIRLRPVIASGCSTPNASSTVGATSASTPPPATPGPPRGETDEFIKPVLVGDSRPYASRAAASPVAPRSEAAVHEQVVGQLDPLPALVAVHCVVASDTSPIRCTRSAPENAPLSTSFEASEPLETASSIRVRSCITIAPAPRFRWPDLGVAHLPLGQPDGSPAGGQLGVGIPPPQLVEYRGLRERDRVARPIGRESPAVQHDQRRASRRQLGCTLGNRHHTSDASFRTDITPRRPRSRRTTRCRGSRHRPARRPRPRARAAPGRCRA